MIKIGVETVQQKQRHEYVQDKRKRVEDGWSSLKKAYDK
jgi:hypothetical protein